MEKETKTEVPLLRWTSVRVHFADADEALDAMEAEEYTTEVAAEESASFMATDDVEERVRKTFGRNTPISADIEISIQPVLDPVNAKHYAHSAAPTHRGSRERMCMDILDISRLVLS